MLINQGLSESVAQKMSEIFACGLLSPEELDDRAFEALREFDQGGALEVLDQFANSDLSHVQNKSAFLCGVMKTYVTKSSSGGEATSNEVSSRADEGKIKALLERTGYTLDITSGQRKYGGPPPGWDGPVPGTGGSEVSEVINAVFTELKCSEIEESRKNLSWRGWFVMVIQTADSCVYLTEVLFFSLCFVYHIPVSEIVVKVQSKSKCVV